jgi:hypothetical protein
MGALLNQLPTLLGVAVGALASYLVASAGERARWRRAQETRWDDRRAAAYADYAELVKQMLRACLRLAAEHGFRPLGVVETTGNAQEELARIESKRTSTFETLLLLGDVDTLRAVQSYTQLALELMQEARRQPVDREAWMAVVRELEIARCAFHDAARRDLGVRHRPKAISDVMWSWYPAPD